jgi:hypothetical protein
VTRCKRFEQEGLMLLEQGRQLDEHFENCADCQNARVEYERLRARIKALGRDDAPSIGWEERVRAALHCRRTLAWWSPPRLALAAAAAVALVAVATYLAPRFEAPSSPSLVVETQIGRGPLRRGAQVHPDDILRLSARTGGARLAELRVYLNDGEVVLRCTTEPPCVKNGDRLSATLRLSMAGLYQPVLLLSDGSLPQPEADLDKDVRDAVKAGAKLVMGTEVEVR